MSAKEEPKKTLHTMMLDSGRRAVQRRMRRERMRPEAVVASMKKWRHDLRQMAGRMASPDDARLLRDLCQAIAEWGDSYPRALQVADESERLEQHERVERLRAEALLLLNDRLPPEETRK